MSIKLRESLNQRRNRYRDRVSQRGVVPTAVKSRNLSDIMFGTDSESVETTLDNSEQVFITYEISQNSEYELKADNYLTVYVGSVATANRLPGGSSVDETQWQVIGPFFDYEAWEDAGFVAYKDYISLYILNISAGNNTDLIIYNKWKYVSPREGA